MSEEGGDGEGVDSEVSFLLSYTLRYVSLTELSGRVVRTDSPVYIREQGRGGRGGCEHRKSCKIHKKEIVTPPRNDERLVVYYESIK